MQSRRRRWITGPGVVALLLGLSLLLDSCTWSRQEPGLFNGPRPSVQASESPTPTPSPEVGVTNPRLPTLGEAVWTTGKGLRLPIRIAVHAVRRIGGATVLDFSVTPIPVSGFPLGMALPESLDLGLARFGEGETNIFLVDGAHHRVYRPLTASGRAELNHCLCTPLWIAQRTLRAGTTTMLQVAYPELPTNLETIDVDVTTVPIFTSVPVTPQGQAPVTAPIDLARTFMPPQPVRSSEPIYFGFGGGQRFRLGVDKVLAGPDLTSIVWTITALDDGSGISTMTGRPFSRDPERRYNYADSSASGARLLVRHRGRSTTLSALSITTKLLGLGQGECLCTDLRLWTGNLATRDGSITVVTNTGRLPAGTTKVDVEFPGLKPMRSVPVTRATDASARLRWNDATETKTYTYRMTGPPAEWSVMDWPNPVPNPRQLTGYRSTVDRWS